MDFFHHQDRARRKTGVLVLYFVLAVVLILLAINASVYGLLRFSGYMPAPLTDWLRQPWWLLITGAVLLVMVAGSVIRSLELRGGGVALNQMLGARPLRADTTDANERRLINVVEEMAIASGMPVPILFVMDDEAGINAFVAGFTPNSATLTVTRGTLETLSRDELQGVVGHEFSHILNADMRINLRLMGVLAGILALGQLGHFLLQGSSRVRLSSSRSKGGSSAAVILGLGLALTIIGWFGLFFGRLIKAAISRQREFLADASSVQFTRNPDGIAGALQKIEQHAGQALLASSHAEDMSHLCFGSSVKLSSLLATHPPIAERIKAIKGRYTGSGKTETGESAASDQALGFAGAASSPVSAMDKHAVIASIGQPGPAHAEYAHALLARLPESLHARLQSPTTAKSVIYALLLVGDAEPEAALRILAGMESATILDEARALRPQLQALGMAARLPLVELAMPALRLLSAPEAMAWRGQLMTLVRSDGQLTLFEVMLLLLLESQLAGARKAPSSIRTYREVLPELANVFALFAEHASTQPETRQALFVQIMHAYTPELPPRPSVRPEAFAASLKKLARLAPLLKQGVLESCVDCVLLDKTLHIAEAELLRAVSAVLDCPMPPLLLNRSSEPLSPPETATR